MSTKKKAVAPRGGAQRNGHLNTKTTSAFSHIPAALYIPLFDGGRFVGLRRFEDRIAARSALRTGGGLL